MGIGQGGIVVGGAAGGGGGGVSNHGLLSGLGDDDHPQYQLREQPVFDNGNSGVAATIDAENGEWQEITLTDDCTITVEGYPAAGIGRAILLKVVQDAGGGNTITWDADVLFGGASAPNEEADAVTWYMLWTDEGDSTIYATQVGAAPATGLSVAWLSDQKATNTAGGGATSGSWETRTLNTEDDPDGIVSLAANQFTLSQDGTYEIWSRLPGFQVTWHQGKIRNITDSVDAIIGSSAFDSTNDQGDSIVMGKIVISGAAKTFELQHFVQATVATNGHGIAANTGVVEVYSQVKITKVA